MKKKAGKKATKLESLAQTHGKEETFKPTTLDQIWGDTGISKYQTMDLGLYQEQLRAMNKSDLQSHASKIGLVPVDDRTVLTDRLLSEFRKHVNSYQIPEDTLNNHQDLTPEMQRVLDEGK